MLLTFPLIVLARVLREFIRKLSKKSQDQLAGANVIVEETLQSISVLNRSQMSLFEVVRYRKSLTEVVNTAVHAAKYRGLFISFSIFALFLVGIVWG